MRTFNTVTLIVDHDDQGAIGLVINQRSAGTLQELIGTGVQIPREVPMYKGGPVRRDMIAVLHKDPESIPAVSRSAMESIGEAVLH